MGGSDGSGSGSLAGSSSAISSLSGYAWPYFN